MSDEQEDKGTSGAMSPGRKAFGVFGAEAMVTAEKGVPFPVAILTLGSTTVAQIPAYKESVLLTRTEAAVIAEQLLRAVEWLEAA